MAIFEVAFFILLIPLLVALVVGWWKYKKYSSLAYILAIFGFLNAVFFILDNYDMGKNGILLLLILCAAFMIALGYWFSKRGKK